MVGSLLEAKLHAPVVRPGRIPRPRLTERLDRVWETPLTLVSAPAGFGKTTVLSQWLAAQSLRGRSVAWVSLDQSDNDPALFWRYLLTALQRAAPEVGAGAATLLESGASPGRAVVPSLLNDLDALGGDLVVVLDDYHAIEAQEVRDGVAILVENLPPRTHLVLATRADPSFPLARRRTRGDLLEVRAADLRFTSAEAARFLNDHMGLSLSPDHVEALAGRTEGWVAALQLAALSLQGRHDVDGFIAGFAGDDRYVVDYLVEEVLQRQPEEVRTFLLHTCLLNRLTGPLCDAVTGQEGGSARLVALERANVFLVPLDDRRQWYRYHHLFADVLRARLLDEPVDRVRALHARAVEWHTENGDAAEAIRHAMAGGDLSRAADLVELAVPQLLRDRQEATLRQWFEELPEEMVRARPVLSNRYAGALLSTGHVAGVEARLRDAERWLDQMSTDGRPGRRPRPPGMVVVDEAQLRDLPAGIAVHRAGLARLLGDVAATMTHARRALDLVDADDHVGRAAASALLGQAYWSSGDLDAAHRWYAAASAELESVGYRSDVAGCAITLADIRIVQGRLRDARSMFEHGLQVVTGSSSSPLRGAADMHVGLATLLVETGDVDGAQRHLVAADDLGEHLGLPQNAYRRQVVAARICEANGAPEAAAAALDDAERHFNSDFSPDVRPVAAMRARVLLRQGRWREVLAWAADLGLSADDDVSYLREFEHLTLARLLLARHRDEPSGGHQDASIALLGRLLRAAEDGGRIGSAIGALALLAVAEQARGDRSAALEALDRALALAAAEGHVRVFLDEGPPMTALLRTAATRGTTRQFTRRLLSAATTRSTGAPVPPALVEPLSERELGVLRLLRTDLSGPDIARELSVSLNTLRTHTRNIYAKLGASSRREAVRRAEQLGLARPHTQR